MFKPLETLKNLKIIAGAPVIVMDELRNQYPDKFNETGAMDYAWFEKEIRPKHFIQIRLDKNSIAFTLQSQPLEQGSNGCHFEALIEAGKYILMEAEPSREKAIAITKLDEALMWLKKERT